MKKKKTGTASGKKHMARVAQLPCIICGSWPVNVHHAETGGGGRKDDMKVLPLCYNHHQGRDGIHTIGRKVWRDRFGTETELLVQVANAVD